jgi:8-oxo-dGTP diphosphatase/A/G-specific adenine glycosylase
MFPETDSLASKQIGVAVIRDDRDLILIDRRLPRDSWAVFGNYPAAKSKAMKRYKNVLNGRY